MFSSGAAFTRGLPYWKDVLSVDSEHLGVCMILTNSEKIQKKYSFLGRNGERKEEKTCSLLGETKYQHLD